jgi:L-2-hydroxyglutarate oxidase LhgO
MAPTTSRTTYDYVVIGGGVSSLGLIAELVEYRKGKSILVVDQHKQLKRRL